MTDHLDVLLIVCLMLVALTRPVEGDNITSTTEADPCEECDQHHTSCYKLTLETVNYSDAQTACESCGGYLASINDNDEYEFITNTYSSRSVAFWIGLWRTNLSGDATANWEWQDGTQLTISKWYTGDLEPNGNSQCGLYTNNGFIDTQCAGARNYICETPNPTTTTVAATTISTTLTTDSSSSRTVTSSATTTDSEGLVPKLLTDTLTGDISTTVANVDDGEKPTPVWVWIIVGVVVAIVVTGICVCIAKCICHKKIACTCCKKKKRKPPIPETPPKSEETTKSEKPKNADPSFPPCAAKYRPNYESVVLENEDKGKSNNGFEKGPPDGTQAHGGSGEQVKPVVSPTDVYAEVMKKDSANGAEMVIVDNTLYGARDFKDQ